MATFMGTGSGDVWTGFAGDDVAYGGAGGDTLNGSLGNDQIFGEEGVDLVNGGDGDDFLDGGASGDTLVGAGGNDQILGQDGIDQVDGGEGADAIDGGAGGDILFGAAGPDQILGGIGTDRIDGGDGDDLIDGGSGGDTINGGIGNDHILGDIGADLVDGGDGADTLDGGVQGDTLAGASGNDSIDGGDGEDHLDGGAGQDTLVGSTSSDTIDGGQGTDTVIFSGKSSDYTVTTTNGVTTVRDLKPATDGDDGTDTLRNVERLQFSDGMTYLVANLAPSLPIDSDPLTDNRVTEGVLGGALVGLTATSIDADGDTIAYSLTNSAGGRFQIDAVTGVVSVADASLIDFETATSHTITVAVADAHGGITTQAFTIQVTDAPPGSISDGNTGALNEVLEGSATGSLIGLTANATDPNGGVVTYSLSGDAGGRFQIDPNTGVVSVADASLIDFEGATSHTITAEASDAHGEVSAQSFVVQVKNAAPGLITDSDGAAADEVQEGASAGTLVGLTASAVDPNGGAITFSLVDDAGGRFQIDAATGVVSVADGSLLDYEADADHQIIVRASDPAGAHSSDQAFTINVTPAPTPGPNFIYDNPAATGEYLQGTAGEADYFVFNAAYHPYPLAEEIVGFESGLDKILLIGYSLSAYGYQGGVNPGVLIYSQDVPGNIGDLSWYLPFNPINNPAVAEDLVSYAVNPQGYTQGIYLVDAHAAAGDVLIVQTFNPADFI